MRPKPFPVASQPIWDKQKSQINTVVLFLLLLLLRNIFVGLLLRTKMSQSLNNKTEKKILIARDGKSAYNFTQLKIKTNNS